MAINKILGNSTPNTISGLLERIKKSSDLIWKKAGSGVTGEFKGMQLPLPEGAYWDLVSRADLQVNAENTISGDPDSPSTYKTGSSNTGSYNFGIDALAEAIKNIPVDLTILTTGGNLGTNSSGNVQITVPRGYYTSDKNLKVPITITRANYTEVAGSHTMGSDKVVVNGTKVTGNGYITTDANANVNISLKKTPKGSATKPSNVTIGAYEYTEGGKTVNYLSITPELGFYTKTAWQTAIAYNPAFNTDLEIEKVTTPDGQETTTVNTIQVPAGYYPSPITISPVLHWNGNDPDRVLNYFSGELVPTLNSKTGVLSEYLGTDSKGAPKKYDYIDPASTYTVKTGSVTISKTIKKDADGNDIVVFSKTATPGWVTVDDVTLNSLTVSAGKHTLSLYSDTKFGGSTAIATGNIVSVNNQFFKDAITAGYLPTSNTYYKIKDGSHSHSIDLSCVDTKFGETNTITDITSINNQLFKLTDTILAGWLNGSTTKIYFKVRDWQRKGNTANTNDFYTVGTAGWIPSSSSGANGYVYVGDSLCNLSNNSAYNTTSHVYDPNNAQRDLTINAGSVVVNPITIKRFTSGEATYAIDSDDISNNNDGNTGNAKFKVTAAMDQDGTVSSYMSAITIDMSLILNELAKI